MLALPYADHEQCSAFTVLYAKSLSQINGSLIYLFLQHDERVMVIWAEALDRIVSLCQDVEERLIKLLWRVRPSGPLTAASQEGGRHRWRTRTCPRTALAQRARLWITGRTTPRTLSRCSAGCIANKDADLSRMRRGR